MGSFFSNVFNRVRSVTRYIGGSFFYRTLSGDPFYNHYTTHEEKLKVVFSNPAVLKVIKLNCDLFSLGKVQAISNEGKERPNDPLLKKLKNPNPFQNQRQFFWDAMFYYMMGCGYLYSTRNILSDITYLYWLNPDGLDFNNKLTDKLSSIVISPNKVQEIKRTTIQYTDNDGSTMNIKLGDITPFCDLSNGVSRNWYKSHSVIDALYKVISNSEAALDAKNINVRFSGKYLVAGQKSKDDVHSLPMSEDEKEHVERNIQSPKSVTAVKNMADIKRYVENIDNLKLDDAFKNDFLIIGSMFNIPKDVLDASLEGSTYENQEKATGRHVEYVFKPKASDLMSGIEKKFGYIEKNINLKYDFSHLSFMKIFEREAEAAKTTSLNNLMLARDAGILTDEEFLDRGKTLYGINE